MKILYIFPVGFILNLIFVFEFHNCFIRVKRIIGGEPDNSTDHGFIVALIGKKGYSWDVLNIWGEYREVYCSGALISDQWIVTAAHCFNAIKEIEEGDNNYQNDKYHNDEEEGDYEQEDEKLRQVQNGQKKIKKPIKTNSLPDIIDFTVPSYWKVRVAVKNLKPTIKETVLNFINKFLHKSTPSTYYKISKIVQHPGYSPWHLENDVALVKLKHKLKNFNDTKYQIIALTNFSQNEEWPSPGQVCKVIGWGCTKFEGPIMNEPYFVDLPVLKSDYCRRIYRTDINLTDSQEFCAGYYGNNKGICSGDSGGPLLCKEGDVSVLAGIVSATHILNPSKYPGIFSRITYFKNWINDVIRND